MQNSRKSNLNNFINKRFTQEENDKNNESASSDSLDERIKNLQKKTFVSSSKQSNKYYESNREGNDMEDGTGMKQDCVNNLKISSTSKDTFRSSQNKCSFLKKPRSKLKNSGRKSSRKQNTKKIRNLSSQKKQRKTSNFTTKNKLNKDILYENEIKSYKLQIQQLKSEVRKLKDENERLKNELRKEKKQNKKFKSLTEEIIKYYDRNKC